MTCNTLPLGSEKGCEACVHFSSYSEGDYGGGPHYVECNKDIQKANLRSFPFKKPQPCFEMDFWGSEFAEMIDGTPESEAKALELFRAKYRRSDG